MTGNRAHIPHGFPHHGLTLGILSVHIFSISLGEVTVWSSSTFIPPPTTCHPTPVTVTALPSGSRSCCRFTLGIACQLRSLPIIPSSVPLSPP